MVAVRGVSLERGILYGLPVLSGLALTFAVAGPGAPRAVEAARVRGLVVEGGARLALRIETVRRFGELEEPTAGALDLEWSELRGPSGTTHGDSDADGFAELVVDVGRPVRTPVTLSLRRAGHVLARGEVAPRPVLTVSDARRCEMTEGEPSLEVCVPRGVAVPEFPEQVVVTRRSRAGEEAVRARLSIDAPGAEVTRLRESSGPACDAGGCRESWVVAVSARAPAVPLEIEARAGASIVSYHGDLPLQPGGMWLDPAWRTADALRLRSATPRRMAYGSLVSPTGRIWGGAIPLKEGSGGVSEGAVPLESLPKLDGEPLTFVVSSDPAEPRGRSVAWPLGPQGRVEVLPPTLLLDGVPAALEAEHARTRQVRWPVAGVIVASALAVVTILVARARRAREALRRHLVEAGAPVSDMTLPLGIGLGILAALALAFGVLAVFAARG